MSITDAVQEHLGPTEIDQISQQLGVSPDVAQRAVSAALPMILGGMASHAARPEGAATVGQAINTHQDATDNVASLLAAGPPADAPSSGGLLGSTYFTAETENDGGEVSRLVIHGGGSGHGIGMCQWGAIGRARAGQDYKTILTTYFPGTTVGRITE